MQFISPLYGFLSRRWPLDQSMKQLLERFAAANNLFVSMMNATIWNGNDEWHSTQDKDILYHIQVTFFEDDKKLFNKCIYPMFKKSIDKFDPIDIFGYAQSIEDYFKLCSYGSVFSTVQLNGCANGKIIKKVENAVNSLVELELDLVTC